MKQKDNIDIRGFACVVLPELNYDAQLIAIRHLLKFHEDVHNNLDNEINELEKSVKTSQGIICELFEFEREEKLEFSVYQSAAHSMSAVGMLAPLMESIFFQAFYGIRKNIFDRKLLANNHARWKHAENEKWDCHFVWGKSGRKEDLVRGIIQLSEATGLSPYLPSDIEIVMKVLFSYRNKMFHRGFEWPLEERLHFWSRIKKENWPSTYLEAATINGQPWVVYLSKEFIWHCIEIIEKVIVSLGNFVFEISGLAQQNTTADPVNVGGVTGKSCGRVR